jgi:hypothetical protein
MTMSSIVSSWPNWRKHTIPAYRTLMQNDDKAQAHENDAETELEMSVTAATTNQSQRIEAMSRERKRRTVSGIVCDPMNRPPAIAQKRPESWSPAWKQFGLCR